MTNGGFAVPKEKQAVTVHLLGGESLQGNIFLEYKPETVTLYQKVASFLEEDASFFTVVPDAGGPQFIAKACLRMLELESAEDESAFSLKRIENIIAVLCDGSRIEGALMADVPEEKARLSDCLNLSERFLSVRAGGKVLFVHKPLVLKVLYASHG